MIRTIMSSEREGAKTGKAECRQRTEHKIRICKAQTEDEGTNRIIAEVSSGYVCLVH